METEKKNRFYIYRGFSSISNCCTLDKAKNEIFNLTYGNAEKINDLLKLLKIDFPKIEVEYKKRDGLMPKRGTLSVRKAKELLNFKTKFSIEVGYKKYINWYKIFWIQTNEKTN